MACYPWQEHDMKCKHSKMDAAALSVVQTARFAPAQADGVRVQGRLRLTFEFRLK